MGDEKGKLPDWKHSKFIPSTEKWTQYVKYLEHFFLTNDINWTDKKLSVLPTVIGLTAHLLPAVGWVRHHTRNWWML